MSALDYGISPEHEAIQYQCNNNIADDHQFIDLQPRSVRAVVKRLIEAATDEYECANGQFQSLLRFSVRCNVLSLQREPIIDDAESQNMQFPEWTNRSAQSI